uniref:Uncharacterized protein n=1 Tax=Arundo donax TaxID=35708 RepID=A0A0A9GP78_ARUDO
MFKTINQYMSCIEDGLKWPNETLGVANTCSLFVLPLLCNGLVTF